MVEDGEGTGHLGRQGELDATVPSSTGLGSSHFSGPGGGGGGVRAPEDGAKPEELKHVRRPNPKVSGPEWAV
jgi:hypothetical protein